MAGLDKSRRTQQSLIELRNLLGTEALVAVSVGRGQAARVFVDVMSKPNGRAREQRQGPLKSRRRSSMQSGQPPSIRELQKAATRPAILWPSESSASPETRSSEDTDVASTWTIRLGMIS